MKKLGKMLVVAGVLLSSLGVSNAFAEKMVQIKGSDTLINLIQKLAEVYMSKNPGKYLAVTGGGSGTGIAALINGKCDIANSSRDIKDKEVKMARDGGVEPKQIVVAMDGLSVIVNDSNDISQLTVEQIGKIFSGEYTNWNQVGGANMPITLYGRQSNSGTFVFFREFVVKADYSDKMKRMNGNAQIVEGVRHDVTGIGYVGVGYVKSNREDLTVLKVAQNVAGPYASPLSELDVSSGKYPIVRTLNQYVSSNFGEDVRSFLEFELGAEGQKIVSDEGFFLVPANYAKENQKVLNA